MDSRSSSSLPLRPTDRPALSSAGRC
jgi:hypothetical protein